MMRRIRLVVLPTLFALSTVAHAEQRVALVIGNSAYKHAVHLNKPVPDAEAVGKALRDIGFQSVEVKTDLSREAMGAALRRFGAKADGADWALVYYTGHGIETDGVNYLLPVDIDLLRPEQVKTDCLPLPALLDDVKNVRKLRLVVIDSARIFPFIERPGAEITDTRPIGSQPVQPDDLRFGSIIAFSAAPGGVPLDGEPNAATSPYAAAFVKAVATPGLDIHDVFSRIRDEVLKASNSKQDPTTYEALRADFYIIHPLAPATQKK